MHLTVGTDHIGIGGSPGDHRAVSPGGNQSKVGSRFFGNFNGSEICFHHIFCGAVEIHFRKDASALCIIGKGHHYGGGGSTITGICQRAFGIGCSIAAIFGLGKGDLEENFLGFFHVMGSLGFTGSGVCPGNKSREIVRLSAHTVLSDFHTAVIVFIFQHGENAIHIGKSFFAKNFIIGNSGHGNGKICVNRQRFHCSIRAAHFIPGAAVFCHGKEVFAAFDVTHIIYQAGKVAEGSGTSRRFRSIIPFLATEEGI